METQMNAAVKELYRDLEEISSRYSELTDTDVRDALHRVLSYFFVWGNPVCDSFPRYFGMFSEEGNKAVAAVVRKFLDASCPRASEIGIALGTERLSLLQNPELLTKTKRQYDEFIGHRDSPLSPEQLPEYFFKGL